MQKIKGRKRGYKNKPNAMKKMAIGTYILIITLNAQGLSAPTKRHIQARWIQNEDPYICCCFKPRDTYRLKVRRWKKILHRKGNQKKDGVAIPKSEKIDLKIKTVTRDKEGHYIMIKGSIKEDKTIVNIYAHNI